MRTKAKQKIDNNLFETAKARTSDIETVKTGDIEYYSNRIDEAIENYKIENDIEDIKALSQLEFNALLIYIGKSVFKVNHKNILDYRDIILIDKILDIYIRVCYRYKKSVSIYGFSYFIAIDYSTLNRWSNNSNRDVLYYDVDNNIYIDNGSITFYKMHNPNLNIVEMPNTMYSALCKKIKTVREHCLTDKTEDGSIPSLALGKIEYGWIEGKDNQLKAQLIENYIKPSNLLEKYND